MSSILFEVLKVVLIVAVTVMIRYVVPMIKSSTSSAALDVAATLVEGAVMAAQQTMKGSTGEEKKAAVLENLDTLLSQRKITLTAEELEILIEAAVKAMKISEASANTVVTINTEKEVN